MKHTKICFKLMAVLLAAASLLSLSACGEARMSQELVYAMDTEMTLTAYGKNRDAGLAQAVSVINSMNAMLDPSISTSKVYEMNHAGGQSVVVSGQIAGMISTAKTVYNRTKGALDLTVYPLLERWGFSNGKYYVPTDEEIYADIQRLCFDQLQLDTFTSLGSYTVTMPADGAISFGAVAKGCASDYAIEAMRSSGVESGIISLGGNVQTLGLKPDGSLWNVAVTDPENTASYLGVVEVGETAVVTSGTYQRFFRQNGEFYHHLIKPSTGYPVSNSLVSLTVVCKSGTLADCLSTGLFVLGENQAMNYWRTYGKSGTDEDFEMIMVTDDYRIICTSGLIEQFVPTNTNYTLSFIE